MVILRPQNATERGFPLKHQNVRQRLIERTVSVIAADGLDKTTTKAIVKSTDIPEAYIYQYFNAKEELLAAAFDILDGELAEKVMSSANIIFACESIFGIDIADFSYEAKYKLFFSSVWRFLVDNREKCFAYIRYFYSPYFEKYSATEHKKRYTLLIEQISGSFREDADVWLLLSHILNVMFDLALKVFSKELSDDEKTAEQAFRLIYCAIQPYFK